MLTKADIERELKFAKDPAKQLVIIAELNGVSVNKIKKIHEDEDKLDDDLIIRKGPGAPRKWSDEKIDELIKMYNDGYTLLAIAHKFGYSSDTPIRNALRNYVYGKRSDFTPRKIGWKQMDIDKAVELKKQGLKTSAIALTFGRTPECVREMLKKHMGDYDESTNTRPRC